MLSGPLHFRPDFKVGPSDIEVGTDGDFKQYDPKDHCGIVRIREDGHVFINKVPGAEVRIAMPRRSDKLIFRNVSVVDETNNGLLGACEVVIPGYQDSEGYEEIPLIVGAGALPGITLPSIGTFCATFESQGS